MTATTFDVQSYNRHSDVAMALLSAIDVRDLERREAELSSARPKCFAARRRSTPWSASMS